MVCVILTSRDVVLEFLTHFLSLKFWYWSDLLIEVTNNNPVSQRLWLRVLSCFCQPAGHDNKGSWIWLWARGSEALGGSEGKGRAVPGNAVREKFRSVFPGRVHSGSELALLPHDSYLMFIKLACQNRAGASDWKHDVHLCGDYLHWVCA